MLILMRTVPSGQDSHIVLACIRACIWAGHRRLAVLRVEEVTEQIAMMTATCEKK